MTPEHVGHHHDHAGACVHDEAAGGLCAHDAACAGSPDACGMEAGACCGGHGADLFAFPTTTETVSIPAVTLAGLCDLVEKLCDDHRLLTQEPDYLDAQRLLSEQAPELMTLRDQFLERMRTLLAEAQAAR